MKTKEGRDFITFEDCVVAIATDGTVVLSNMVETFKLSKEEFNKLVAFVAKKNSLKD
jgi:hypothetical protein